MTVVNEHSVDAADMGSTAIGRWEEGPIASPLRVIAKFIGLSEALAVAGAAATDGTARLMLTSFAVAFPILVLVVFVWLLVRHPANLYAPTEYTADTSVEVFAAALDRRQQAFEVVLADAVPEALLSANSSAPAPHMRTTMASALDEALNDRTVTVVLDAFRPGRPMRIPVTERTIVQDLLDQTYFSLEATVEAFTYGQSWILQREGGERLVDLGSDYRRERPDTRLLREVEIAPGDVLHAVHP